MTDSYTQAYDKPQVTVERKQSTSLSDAQYSHSYIMTCYVIETDANQLICEII